jgi:hypothetical protein
MEVFSDGVSDDFKFLGVQSREVCNQMPLSPLNPLHDHDTSTNNFCD